jgi:hypothetical protein
MKGKGKKMAPPFTKKGSKKAGPPMPPKTAS